MSFRELTNNVISERPDDVRKYFNLLHYSYKRACLSLHANSLGNLLKIGKKKEDKGVNSGPTSYGIGLPLFYSTSSFWIITNISCKIFDFDSSSICEKLEQLSLFFYNQSYDENDKIIEKQHNTCKDERF